MSEITDSLVKDLEEANAAYREGNPILSDDLYDHMIGTLKELNPNHPYLHSIEPEKIGKKEVRHPKPMLSMEKAYTHDEMRRFFDRVEKAATEIGMRNIYYTVTPKLDGIAGRDDGTVFVTRGNGTVGNDITEAFERGVVPIGGRGRGVGEIVMPSDYFETEMANEFEHPRNLVAGIINSDTLSGLAKKALEDCSVHFIPYLDLEELVLDRVDIIENIEEIYTETVLDSQYPTDGIVISVKDSGLSNFLGATSHHHRWQIAYKRKGDTAITTVNDITWQVGRTGKITPVLEVEPVKISGATIRRVTAHNAGTVMDMNIGRGAEIRIIRSGEVIPKIEEVVGYGSAASLPEKCPTCNSKLKWDNDFLMCHSNNCNAKTERTIRHWFSTLGIDYFGPATIKKIVAFGARNIFDVYSMRPGDFKKAGFGGGEIDRLWYSLIMSVKNPVEDWRLLAAFGIKGLGRGDSKKLLQHFNIEDILYLRRSDDISDIDGFGSVTGSNIIESTDNLKEIIEDMLNLDFNLIRTAHAKEEEKIESPISGKNIVFSGKMIRSRETMMSHATSLGANPQSGVSMITDFLVCGDGVGKSKISKAKRLGVKIITEKEYHDMVGGENGI